MNEDTPLKLVDKLAEKLGVAVEEVGPFAAELVRQIQLRGVVYCIAAGVLLLVALLAGCGAPWCFRRAATAERHNDEGWILGGVTATVAALGLFGASLGCFFYGLSLWLAPLPSILGL